MAATNEPIAPNLTTGKIVKIMLYDGSIIDVPDYVAITSGTIRNMLESTTEDCYPVPNVSQDMMQLFIEFATFSYNTLPPNTFDRHGKLLTFRTDPKTKLRELIHAEIPKRAPPAHPVLLTWLTDTLKKRGDINDPAWKSSARRDAETFCEVMHTLDTQQFYIASKVVIANIWKSYGHDLMKARYGHGLCHEDGTPIDPVNKMPLIFSNSLPAELRRPSGAKVDPNEFHQRGTWVIGTIDGVVLPEQLSEDQDYYVYSMRNPLSDKQDHFRIPRYFCTAIHPITMAKITCQTFHALNDDSDLSQFSDTGAWLFGYTRLATRELAEDMKLDDEDNYVDGPDDKFSDDEAEPQVN